MASSSFSSIVLETRQLTTEELVEIFPTTTQPVDKLALACLWLRLSREEFYCPINLDILKERVLSIIQNST